jgi:hypothetical protein
MNLKKEENLSLILITPSIYIARMLINYRISHAAAIIVPLFHRLTRASRADEITLKVINFTHNATKWERKIIYKFRFVLFVCPGI